MGWRLLNYPILGENKDIGTHNKNKVLVIATHNS